MQQEEAEVVELDKANHTAGGLGLFKGRFGYFARPDRRTAPIIRDTQDGVDRCPNCAWELEEGYCKHVSNILKSTHELCKILPELYGSHKVYTGYMFYPEEQS